MKILEQNQDLFCESHRSRVLAETSPRSLISKAAEINCVAIDVLSMVRNGVHAIGVFAGAAVKVAGAVAGMSIAGGVMGIASSINIMTNAGIKISQAYSYGDWEGGFDQACFGLMGASYATVASNMIVSNAATFAQATATAAASGTALTIGGFAMYGLIGIRAAYGAVVNLSFRNELDRMEDESLHTALSWLRAKVTGASESHKLQKKWDRFAFRSSEAACRLVREQATPELLERLEAGDPHAVQEARFIIREVRRDNAKRLMRFYLLLAIAIIGISAYICGLLLSGPLSPLFFMLGAVLWIGIDSSGANAKLGDWLYGKSHIPSQIVGEAPKLRARQKPTSVVCCA